MPRNYKQIDVAASLKAKSMSRAHNGGRKSAIRTIQILSGKKDSTENNYPETTQIQFRRTPHPSAERGWRLQRVADNRPSEGCVPPAGRLALEKPRRRDVAKGDRDVARLLALHDDRGGGGRG